MAPGWEPVQHRMLAEACSRWNVLRNADCHSHLHSPLHDEANFACILKPFLAFRQLQRRWTGQLHPTQTPIMVDLTARSCAWTATLTQRGMPKSNPMIRVTAGTYFWALPSRSTALPASSSQGQSVKHANTVAGKMCSAQGPVLRNSFAFPRQMAVWLHLGTLIIQSIW